MVPQVRLLNTEHTGLINAIWQRTQPERVRDLHQKHPRPEGLRVCRTSLNEELVPHLKKKSVAAHLKDVKLRSIQGLISRAAVPVAKGCHVLTAGGQFKRQPQVNLSVDTITCLAAANQQINTLRKELIQPLMTPKLRAICKPSKNSQPSEELFPALMEGAKMAKQGASMFAGAFGRGQWHQPYQNRSYGQAPNGSYFGGWDNRGRGRGR
jgi:hypothetical protein